DFQQMAADRTKGDWRKKLHPAFFDIAALNQQFETEWRRIRQRCDDALGALTVDAPEDRRKELRAQREQEGFDLCDRLEKRLNEINARYADMPDNPLAFNYLDLTDSAVGDPLFQYMHNARHGEALAVTEARHKSGDIEAWQKIARTEEDRLHQANRDGRNKK